MSTTLDLDKKMARMLVHEPYRVSVEQYRAFQRQGFVAIPGIVSIAEIAELREHTEQLMQGRLPEQSAKRADGSPNVAIEAPPDSLSPEEKAHFFLRIHMLHRRLELHERYMLHPRVLDVLESLIGPDVLALQTMLFLKPAGSDGQGWHQDSYYIPTHPDTLCGAWIAIDDADEFNGAMWMALGSREEPIYPSTTGVFYGTRELGDITVVADVSHPDDTINGLAPIANRYAQVLVPAKAGDVVFFNGHILHRSKANASANRFRRAFVSHYCNARSFTQWGAGAASDDPHGSPVEDPITRMTNGSHILARGNTHLPFATPLFGTPCAATLSPDERAARYQFGASTMMGGADGDMGPVVDTDRTEDDHE